MKTRRSRNKSGKSYCDLCKDQSILIIHHINGRNIPKPNHPSNLCNICLNCHAKLHYDFIVIEKWVRTTNGLELLYHKKGEEGLTGEEAKPPLLI